MKTKTRIISAFPCLGKTSLTQKYKDIYFDFEIYETRATKGMNQLQEFEFFKNCARNIQILYETGFYEVIFITDDERLKEKIYFVEPGKYIEDLVPNIRRLYDRE